MFVFGLVNRGTTSVFHMVCVRWLWRFLIVVTWFCCQFWSNGHTLKVKNSKWVWFGNTTIKNCKQAHGTARKSHTVTTRQQGDKLSKATRSIFPIKMIAKLEWTWSNAQQNIEQLQNPIIGVTINNDLTTTEPPPYNGNQPKPFEGGLLMHFTGTKSSP